VAIEKRRGIEWDCLWHGMELRRRIMHSEAGNTAFWYFWEGVLVLFTVGFHGVFTEFFVVFLSLLVVDIHHHRGSAFMIPTALR
jgi:hypothetical protein